MSKKLLFFMIFFVLMSVIVWMFVKDKAEEQAHGNEPLAHETKCPHKNINPLRCEPDMAAKKKEYVVLRRELNDYIEQKKLDAKLTSASIYFRDLQNGPIMSINTQENFTPASLLKLPIMISYYKKTEDNPTLLQTRVKVPEDIKVLNQEIKNDMLIEPGNIYTIDELIKMMITKSDNVAASLLIVYLQQNFPQDNYISTLNDLGFINPKDDTSKQFITTQNYASIFRSLYNSSYLNVEMSNRALDLLIDSEFHDGLVAGVPADVRVAHKFGERNDGNEQQLHDCGIVYYPNNPYILCVMTRGRSIDELKMTIKEVSQKVYKEFHYRNTH